MSPCPKLYRAVPRVQRVRRRLSTGEIRDHFYHRPTGTALPAPHEPGFRAAYDAAEAQLSSEQESPPKLVTVEKPDPEKELTTFNAFGDPLLTPEEVVLRLRNSVSVGTLANWRAGKIGPPFTRAGKAILYPLSLLLAWEKGNTEMCDLEEDS